uniref:Uncharacterized protein n=1 Tax=Arundo donax TaxID=35708 RepID=A0A0A9B0J6_ARUDO
MLTRGKLLHDLFLDCKFYNFQLVSLLSIVELLSLRT